MLHGHLHPLGDLHRPHAEDGRVQGVVDGGLPAGRDAVKAVSHTQDGAHRGPVAVGVKALLHGLLLFGHQTRGVKLGVVHARVVGLELMIVSHVNLHSAAIGRHNYIFS